MAGSMRVTVPAWRGDWQERITQRLLQRGFESCLAFLEANPGVSYTEMARLLSESGDIAPVQLERLHARSAGVDERDMAILDSLARPLREALKKGWGVGQRWRGSVAAALASWNVAWGGRARSREAGAMSFRSRPAGGLDSRAEGRSRSPEGGGRSPRAVLIAAMGKQGVGSVSSPIRDGGHMHREARTQAPWTMNRLRHEVLESRLGRDLQDALAHTWLWKQSVRVAVRRPMQESTEAPHGLASRRVVAPWQGRQRSDIDWHAGVTPQRRSWWPGRTPSRNSRPFGSERPSPMREDES